MQLKDANVEHPHGTWWQVTAEMHREDQAEPSSGASGVVLWHADPHMHLHQSADCGSLPMELHTVFISASCSRLKSYGRWPSSRTRLRQLPRSPVAIPSSLCDRKQSCREPRQRCSILAREQEAPDGRGGLLGPGARPEAEHAGHAVLHRPQHPHHQAWSDAAKARTCTCL